MFCLSCLMVIFIAILWKCHATPELLQQSYFHRVYTSKKEHFTSPVNIKSEVDPEVLTSFFGVGDDLDLKTELVLLSRHQVSRHHRCFDLKATMKTTLLLSFPTHLTSHTVKIWGSLVVWTTKVWTQNSYFYINSVWKACEVFKNRFVYLIKGYF